MISYDISLFLSDLLHSVCHPRFDLAFDFMTELFTLMSVEGESE